MPLTFITGPVRSGKSRFAERLASAMAGHVTYVATARSDPLDPEWTARLAHHAARRPRDWSLVETAGTGGAALVTLARAATPADVLLIDSLGTWLADRMACRYETSGADAEIDAAALEAELDEVATALLATSAAAVVVGEEVGWSIVPAFASGRIFRDVLGRVQQRLAAGAAAAYLVVAGFALDLHAQGRSVDGAREQT